MTYRLGELADLVTKGTTPKQYVESFAEDSVIFIRAENINGTIIGEDSFKYIDKETHEKELKRSILKENDILITIAGSLGRMAKITRKFLPANTNQAVAIVRITRKDVNVDYIFYALRKPNLIENAIASSSQSVQPNLNLQQISDLEIELPSIDLQNKIASILKSFDNLIEHNNSLINKFNKMLWAFYDKYFCYSVDDILPKGWRLLTLGDVTSNNREKVGNRLCPVFSALNTGILMPSTEYFTKQVFSKDISKYIVVRKHDFAYNPARINIGSIGINDFDYDGCVSPVYVAFTVEEEYVNFFRYFLKSVPFKEEVASRASGSVRQTLNYSDFAMIKLPYPPKETISAFNKEYYTITKLISDLKEKNESLSSLRDSILMKIFNGEFDEITFDSEE